MLSSKNSLYLYRILLLTIVIFPFGQILKLTLFSQVKVSLLDALSAIFVLIGFVSGFRIKNKFRPFLRKPGLLFIGFSLLSLLIASFKLPLADILQGLFYLTRFTIYFFFYLQLVWFFNNNKNRKEIVSKGLLLAGSCVAVFGILQYFIYPDLRNLLYLGWDPHYYRLFSTFFDPNFTGLILVLTLIQFIFWDFGKKQKNKLIYFILFFITTTALILTRSRSAYIALFGGLVLLFLKAVKLRKEFILGLITAVVLVALIPKPNVDVFNLFRLNSAVARVNNWKWSLRIGVENPLFGQGFGILRFPDSSFLYVWAGTGISGCLFFVWMWIKIFKLAFLRKTQLLISVAVIFISSWFNNTFFYPWVLYWLFLMLAKDDQGS